MDPDLEVGRVCQSFCAILVFTCGQVMSVIYVQNAEAQIGCRNLSVKLTMFAWFLTCILGTRTGVCQLSRTKRRY